MHCENTISSIKMLNELIDNAAELPLECQDWLLAIAKAMRYTKKCLKEQIITKQPA